jgi:hypothetical protein
MCVNTQSLFCTSFFLDRGMIFPLQIGPESSVLPLKMGKGFVSTAGYSGEAGLMCALIKAT